MIVSLSLSVLGLCVLYHIWCSVCGYSVWDIFLRIVRKNNGQEKKNNLSSPSGERVEAGGGRGEAGLLGGQLKYGCC